MRESYELAWLTVKNHVKNEIILEKIFDIDFTNPVSVGDFIKFEAKICLIQVLLNNNNNSRTIR